MDTKVLNINNVKGIEQICIDKMNDNREVNEEKYIYRIYIRIDADIRENEFAHIISSFTRIISLFLKYSMDNCYIIQRNVYIKMDENTWLTNDD